MNGITISLFEEVAKKVLHTRDFSFAVKGNRVDLHPQDESQSFVRCFVSSI